MDGLINFLGTITLFTGLFGIIDAGAKNHLRAGVAEYIFGFHNKTFRNFDQKTIQALLSVFVRDNRLRKIRILIFSYLFSVGCLVAFLSLFVWFSASGQATYSASVAHLLNMAIRPKSPDEVRIVFLLFGVLPLAAYLFDLYSLWISKKLFWNRNFGLLLTPVLILADILLSVAPFLILAFATTLPFISADNFLGGFFVIGAFFQVPSMVFINFVQISVLLFGSMFRLLVTLTKLNRYTVLVTNFHEYPFTFLGLMIGLMTALVGHLI